MKKNKREGSVTVEPDDSPDFCIVPLPDEPMSQLGWKRGDKIKVEIADNQIVITKLG